jgi:sigma-B regulation protein RsbU (phosphoserine phosphatase)
VTAVVDAALRDQLFDRRGRLAAALPAAGREVAAELRHLLDEVDAALERFETGSFGLCEVCHDPVEADRLAADPLVRFCLDHLTSLQRRALQHDLDTAARVQRALLPPPDLAVEGWEMGYLYEPAGAVSGDFLDLVAGRSGGDHYFVFGDISGKGVAASMVMAQLHAIFRAAIAAAPELPALMAEVNRVLCESTPAASFATVVAGRLGRGGEVELANAGHPPALHLAGGEVRSLPSTGMPLGMFCDGVFGVERLALRPGDGLLLYTDGLTEAASPSGEEYGGARLSALLAGRDGSGVAELLATCRGDLAAFRDRGAPADDLTVMALRRAAAPLS